MAPEVAPELFPDAAGVERVCEEEATDPEMELDAEIEAVLREDSEERLETADAEALDELDREFNELVTEDP